MRHAVSTPMKRATILVLAAVCAACDPGGDGKPEKAAAPLAASAPSAAETQAIAPESLKQPIRFAAEALPSFVKRTYGIGKAETFGRWSTGKLAIIELNGTLPPKFDLELVAGGFGPNVGAKARIIIGAMAKDVVISGDVGAASNHVVSFDGIGAESIIAIEVAVPTSPAELGKGDDARKLGLALVSITIRQKP